MEQVTSLTQVQDLLDNFQTTRVQGLLDNFHNA